MREHINNLSFDSNYCIRSMSSYNQRQKAIGRIVENENNILYYVVKYAHNLMFCCVV